MVLTVLWVILKVLGLAALFLLACWILFCFCLVSYAVFVDLWEEEPTTQKLKYYLCMIRNRIKERWTFKVLIKTPSAELASLNLAEFIKEVAGVKIDTIKIPIISIPYWPLKK